MKINLKQLKLHYEDVIYFNFNGSIDDGFLADSGAGLKAPVEMEITVQRQAQVFYGAGTLKTVIEYNCSRCLKLFVRPVALELTFIIAEAGKESGYAEEFIILENDEADITAYIEGVIFESLPLSPICDPNCQGLCPICGGDKNIDDCQCKNEEIDPRWEKLQKLNISREGG